MADTAEGEDVQLIAKKNSKSVVWQYFGFKTEDTTNPICRVCARTIPCKGANTTNLFSHLRDHHAAQYSQCKSSQKTAKMDAASTIVSTQQQPTLMECFQKKESLNPNSNEAWKCHKAIGYWIGKDMMPLYSVERKGFRKMIEALNPRYSVPSRRFFADRVMNDLYHKTQGTVKANLNEADYFSFTTDMWSSRTLDSYMSLTVHYVNSNWELQAHCLGAFPFREDHTGEHIAQGVLDMLEEWGLPRRNVVVGTTDNASNNKRAFEILEMKRLGCFGHNLDLSINKALKIESVNRAVRNCRIAVDAFSRSGKRKAALTRKQSQLDLPQHKLIHVSVTSLYYFHMTSS